MLPVLPGAARCRQAHYAIIVRDASSEALVGLDCDHGPDDSAFRPHTANVIAATAASIGSVVVGDTDASEPLMDYLIPMLRIGTNNAGGAEQWAVVEVWETRKLLHLGPAGLRCELLAGDLRLSSGAGMSSPGLALPWWDRGQFVNQFMFTAVIHNASSGARLGCL